MQNIYFVWAWKDFFIPGNTLYYYTPMNLERVFEFQRRVLKARWSKTRSKTHPKLWKWIVQ